MADMCGGKLIFGDAQQIPLDFEFDDATHLPFFELIEFFAKQLARREIKRHAGNEVFVTIIEPTSGSQGSTRNVAGSGTMMRFGEPVIASRPIPPPRE